ncbi:MAG: hypothetical protein JWM97_1803 [Phycisphaerales bacterium]|nr:hypothetical protein [Phycisphaerales bacterium]
MNPERDPLELELESFPPPQMPAALRARIAQAIDAERQAGRATAHARWPGRWVLAGALAAAACVTVSLAWFHGRTPDPIPGVHPIAIGPPEIATRQSPSRQFATLAAYTRAAAESPDRLDSLMNADAARSLLPGTSREMRAFGDTLDDLKP